MAERNFNRNKKRNQKPDLSAVLMVAGILVIILLLIFIIKLNRNAAEKEAQSRAIESSIAESESISIAESIEESLAQALEESKKQQGLAECTGGPIKDLTDRYFDARKNADVAEMNEVFGRTGSGSADEELSSLLSAQAAWVRSFDDVQIRTIPGKDENSVIGVVKYRINFRRVNTKAPCITYFYAEKDENGNWHMRENLLKDTREFIEEQFEKTGVNGMIAENTAELRDLLSYDSDLALVYTSFMNGDIYSDSRLDPDHEPEVKVFDDPADSVLINITNEE